MVLGKSQIIGGCEVDSVNYVITLVHSYYLGVDSRKHSSIVQPKLLLLLTLNIISHEFNPPEEILAFGLAPGCDCFQVLESLHVEPSFLESGFWVYLSFLILILVTHLLIC